MAEHIVKDPIDLATSAEVATAQKAKDPVKLTAGAVAAVQKTQDPVKPDASGKVAAVQKAQTEDVKLVRPRKPRRSYRPVTTNGASQANGLPRNADDFGPGSSKAAVSNATPHHKAQASGPSKPRLLHQSYQVRDAAYFTLGRVFKALWAETIGPKFVSKTSEARGVTEGVLGEWVHSKVRPFVVVRAGGNYCVAVPISTYGGLGVGKPHVNKAEHVVIYTGKKEPDRLPTEKPGPEEEPMRSRAIRVLATKPELKLDAKSRVHWGKLHTIEHNIKVEDIGIVDNICLEALEVQFMAVWKGRPDNELVQPTEHCECCQRSKVS